MRVSLYSEAFAAVVCTAMCAGPASAHLVYPSVTTPQEQADRGKEIASQGMRSVTGDLYSQGMMVQNGPWAGESYSQGMRMSTGDIYTQGMQITFPGGWNSFELPSHGCAGVSSNCTQDAANTPATSDPVDDPPSKILAPALTVFGPDGTDLTANPADMGLDSAVPPGSNVSDIVPGDPMSGPSGSVLLDPTLPPAACVPGILTIDPVPQPASLALLGPAILLVGSAARRRRRL
jgi:hypothetical protein